MHWWEMLHLLSHLLGETSVYSHILVENRVLCGVNLRRTNSNSPESPKVNLVKVSTTHHLKR